MVSGLSTMDTLESFERRRKDNFAWRLMSLKRQQQQNKAKKSPVTPVNVSPNANTKTRASLSSFPLPPVKMVSPYKRGDVSTLESVITTPPINLQSQQKKENQDDSAQEQQPLQIHKSVSCATFSGLKPTPLEIPTSYSSPSQVRGTSSPLISPRPLLPESSFGSHKASGFESGFRKAIFDRRGGVIGKGSICTEYSDLGTGDFRSPSFVVVDSCNGSSISPLRYRRHEIIKGKKHPTGLPHFRQRDGDEVDCMTLIVTMGDLGSGLEIDLVYTVFNDYDAVIRRTVFRNLDYLSQSTINRGRSGKIIQRAMSTTNDFDGESEPFYSVKLCGSWGRERQIVSSQLTHGISSFASTRGVSGHQHCPFVAISVGPPSETSGEVKAWSLVYSGNYVTELQLNDLGRLRVNIGINPECWQWFLKEQEFQTPECVIVRSSEGLGGMSRCLHRLLRERLMPRVTWAIRNPPILINTWEPYYFDIDSEKVMKLANHAKKIGVDLLVLDDGWFEGRSDDRRSLGNWVADPKKFPSLCKLSQDLKAMGWVIYNTILI